jgi:hypothetical protein
VTTAHGHDEHPPHAETHPPRRTWLHGPAPLIVAAVGGALFWAWMTLPPHKIALDDACTIDTLTAQISAKLYGRRFWAAQRTAVEAEIQKVQLQQIEWEHQVGDKGVPPSAIMTPTERRMRRLSEQTVEEEAQRRGQELQDRFDWLVRCDEEVAAHQKPDEHQSR